MSRSREFAPGLCRRSETNILEAGCCRPSMNSSCAATLPCQWYEGGLCKHCKKMDFVFFCSRHQPSCSRDLWRCTESKTSARSTAAGHSSTGLLSRDAPSYRHYGLVARTAYRTLGDGPEARVKFARSGVSISSNDSPSVRCLASIIYQAGRASETMIEEAIDREIYCRDGRFFPPRVLTSMYSVLY